ncbi:MAG: proteasome assembly chaperone family protein [Streptosporangiales bacterium]
MNLERLYEIGDGSVEGRPVLVHALTGFIDAGEAGEGFAQQLLSTLPHRTVASFDVDQLIDYRSRRPEVAFVEDHFEQYAAPELTLYAVRDDAGAEFLLLTGPEPDMQWERFAAAVRQLVDTFDVSLTVGVHGIPMTVPHTRPLGVTTHATRAELVTTENPWHGEARMPSGAAVLLELRLGEWGHDAMGFAVHVPHYLAENRYPEAIVELLQSVSRATGLLLPGGDLPEEIEYVRSLVDEQVENSEAVRGVVQRLEAQYDGYYDSDSRTQLPVLRESLPSGDDLAAEAEQFLADLGNDDGEER